MIVAGVTAEMALVVQVTSAGFEVIEGVISTLDTGMVPDVALVRSWFATTVTVYGEVLKIVSAPVCSAVVTPLV